MKKTLIALAAVAATGAAFAQVTITGTFNAAYQSNGGNTGIAFPDAALNFAASEDLGGGLKAAANVAFNGGTKNSNLVNDGQNISLSGGFGSVTLSAYTSSSAATKALSGQVSLQEQAPDASTMGIQDSQAQAIIYQLPEFVKGLTTKVATSESYLGTYTSNAKASSHTGTNGIVAKTNSLSLGYANGPFAAGANFKFSTYQSDNVAYNTREAYVTYDLGVAKAGYGFNKKSSNANATSVLGLSAPISGALSVGLDYVKYGDLKQTQYGANYALSKRTSVNVSAGKAVDTDANSQYRIKLSHSF
jgi:predicted porin